VLRGASIVCISSIDWNFNRQIPQEVSHAFAERGNRVLFIENTGVRNVTLADAPRLWSRFLHWWHARGSAKQVANDIKVLSPLVLPFPYSPAAVSINTRVLLRALRSWARQGDGPLIVVTFLPTPLARELIAELSPALVIYYCLDRLAESSPAARKVVHSERKLFAEADLVLATSQLLYEMAAELSSHVNVIASGVRVKDYERARQSRAQAHPALSGLCRPIVGYVGSLRSSTDLELLLSAARLAPDLQFVLVGPRFVDVTCLEPQPNVRLVNAIPHTDVMNYMVRFDVGVLPYLIDEFTAGIMPVKLKEYLAAGLPVVSTRLPEVCNFAEEHRGLVRFAGSTDEFVAALRAAVTDNSASAIQERIAVARKYDWNDQMEAMMGLIEESLAQRVNRFQTKRLTTERTMSVSPN
jgi:glycosyltransferase involved in cell wall biosynthesis